MTCGIQLALSTAWFSKAPRPRLFFVIAICPICKTIGIRLITIGLLAAGCHGFLN